MKFDDKNLIALAKATYYASEMAPQKVPHLSKLFTKDELDNTERNQLISFVGSYRQAQPKSIKSMKTELLNIIGFKSEYSSPCNVNRVELEAIYNFVMSNLKVKN